MNKSLAQSIYSDATFDISLPTECQRTEWKFAEVLWQKVVRWKRVNRRLSMRINSQASGSFFQVENAQQLNYSRQIIRRWCLCAFPSRACDLNIASEGSKWILLQNVHKIYKLVNLPRTSNKVDYFVSQNVIDYRIERFDHPMINGVNIRDWIVFVNILGHS